MSDVASSVTLIVPTVYHRAALFARTLRYFSRANWRGPVIVSDHSPISERDVINGIVAQHRDLDIMLIAHPPEAHFLTRLADCAQNARTDYVHLHADDDFLVFDTLEHLLAVMRSDPGCAAAMGVNVHLDFETKGLRVVPKTSSSNADAYERLIAQLEDFSSVLYALRRRTEFIDSVSNATLCCPDVQFWQYLESCHAAVTGKIFVIDDLHYVRQLHQAKWSNHLVQSRSLDHFPLLILSPEFSSRVAAFRAALIDLCIKQGIAVDQPALEDGVVNLLYRGFGAMGLPPRRTEKKTAIKDDVIAGQLQDASHPTTKALKLIFKVFETSR